MADNGINGSIGLSGGDESKVVRWQVVGRKKSEDLWWEIVPETKELQRGAWNKDPNAPRHELVYKQDTPVFTGGEGYRVYVDDLLLPVPPEKLELSIQNRNKTMDLVGGGQINLLKTPGLSEVKFTALLPNQPYHFAMYEGGYRNAHAYLDKLEALKVNRKSFPLRVLRVGPGGDTVMESTSLTASLEDYSILEDAEQYGLDMAVDLTFKQFQPYGTKVYELTGDTAATEVKQREVTLTTGQETYTLQEGDTLYTVAKKLYGDGDMWTQIYDLNKDVIEAAAKADGLESSSNGNEVYAGTELKLPPKAAEQAVAMGQKAFASVGGGSQGTQENARIIYQFFKSNFNCPDELIAGALGNWNYESGYIDPTSVEGIYDEKHVFGPRKQNAMANPDSYFWGLKKQYDRRGLGINVSAYVGRDGIHWPGIGLGGFTGVKATDLMDFAAHISMNWYDLGAQLLYCVNNEPFVARDGSRQNNYNDLFVNKAKHSQFVGSGSQAGYLFFKIWEMPGASVKKYNALAGATRSNYTAKWLKEIRSGRLG